MQHPRPFEDRTHRIELNCNYPAHAANAFLEYARDGWWHHGFACIGSADQDLDGRWRVVVDAPYDPETDSDARLVGYFPTQDEAIRALWNERHAVYC